MKIKETNLIKLRLVKGEYGHMVLLDDKALHHVANYNIKQGNAPGTAILTLEMLVEFPNRENTK